MTKTTAEEDIAQGSLEELKTEQKTLPGVILKMKNIGAEQYNGMIFDNVYSIFNQLLVSEKRLLLKGVINMLLIIEDKTINGSLIEQPYAHVTAIGKVQKAVEKVELNMSEGMNNLEDFNKREMIKLRSSVTRITLILFGIGIIVIGSVAIWLANDKAETISIFTQIGSVISEVLGLN